MKIAVIGAGSWGTAIAALLGEKHADVALWVRGKELATEIASTRRNTKYLPDALLPAHVLVTDSLEKAADGAEVVFLVTPSHAIRETAARLARVLKPGVIVVTAAKGLEVNSHKRMSEVVLEEVPGAVLVALSGPNHAEEVALRQPSATVAASESRQAAELIQDLMNGTYLRVYTNPDIVGVELAGALKNIIALGTGVAEGIGLGDNAKAALMTRGLAEIARLGVALGATPRTFAGLAGVGDLIVTCTSRHSRNRRAGLLLAEGKSADEVIAATNMVVEGIRSTRVAYELSRQKGIEMPIAEQIYRVLYGGLSPREAVMNLMSRGPTHEVEEGAEIDNWN